VHCFVACPEHIPKAHAKNRISGDHPAHHPESNYFYIIAGSVHGLPIFLK